ncbi:MAG: cytochrome c biogenesis protein CcsA, partial [Desulfovibrio sp.]|nr:cytochrome c biogenesis protein CcsA [Desulfovibrio sp.]
MYSIANFLLMGAFLCAVFIAGAAVLEAAFGLCPGTPRSSSGQASSGQASSGQASFASLPDLPLHSRCLPLAETAQWLILGALTVGGAVLLHAFITLDFRLEYVVRYSDTTLPLFYRLTALWAGQSGSLLFWAWSVAAGGAVFRLTPAYGRITPGTRLWFWAFFLSIMAFFLLLLITWNDPFDLWRDQSGLPAPPPRDGYGLNPQLQSPGMIFHPPLLFLGYGGFAVPGCLALAQTLGKRSGAGNDPAWGPAVRPFILTAWGLLTAGILLGAWWAYSELGWGGYWAWDPVENASLLPWLTATAYLHTAIIERRSGKLGRTNVFLLSMSTVSAFFAAYLVRGGAVASLHGFGASEVSLPLLLFTLTGFGLVLLVSLAAPPDTRQDFGNPFFSKEGLLILVSWIFLALACVILLATLSPAIAGGLRNLSAHLFPGRIPADIPALGPDFYNRACLPLFAAPALLLLACPFRAWDASLPGSPVRTALALILAILALASPLLFRLFLAADAPPFSRYIPLLFSAAIILLLFPARDDPGSARLFQGVLILFGLVAVLLFRLGVEQPTALVAAASALAATGGIAALFALKPQLFRARSSLAAHGAHLGLLLITIGVAFSGPYQARYSLTLNVGESAARGEYLFTLTGTRNGQAGGQRSGEPNYRYFQADLAIFKAGRPLGVLSPQRRQYAKFEKQPYAEVATLFSLGNEIYATLLSPEEEAQVTLMVAVNPLINWIWLGGALLSLCPILGLIRPRRIRGAPAAA